MLLCLLKKRLQGTALSQPDSVAFMIDGLRGSYAKSFMVPSKYKHLDSPQFILPTDKREHKMHMCFFLLHK